MQSGQATGSSTQVIQRIMKVADEYISAYHTDLPYVHEDRFFTELLNFAKSPLYTLMPNLLQKIHIYLILKALYEEKLQKTPHGQFYSQVKAEMKQPKDKRTAMAMAIVFAPDVYEQAGNQQAHAEYLTLTARHFHSIFQADAEEKPERVAVITPRLGSSSSSSSS